MKTILLTAVFACFLMGATMAQNSDQNPRAQEAYEAYEGKVDAKHAATLGATVDKTYQAYDPILIKEQRKRERIEFRRQLRLERARRPRIVYPRWGWRRW